MAAERQRSPRPGFLAGASLAGLIAAILFVGFPAIDLAVADLFYRGDGAFAFHQPGIGPNLRAAFRILFWSAALAALIGAVLATVYWRQFLGLGFPHWLYLALCLIIGPGLVANTLFKDNWGRARPVQIERFGGTKAFTPPLVRSDQCQRNCSFVAGEAAAIYAVFFAGALLARRRRREMIAVACLAGSIAGLVRMAAGGHFLSDVVFAGVFMALIARALFWIMFEAWPHAFAEAGPLHERLTAAARSAGALARRAGARWRSISASLAKRKQGGG